MKDDRVYLGHIRDAIQDIQQYTAVGRDAFMTDRMQQDDVIRKLEIIGEAVKHLSDGTTAARQRFPGAGSQVCATASRTITLAST